jgi:hypothetical protein
VKLLLIQPAIPRFQWELEVLLANIRQFTNSEVVLLFSESNFTIPIFFREKYGCSVFTFTDRREDKSYIPSIRPYLWWQFLKEHPEAENETYIYIDSDVIFREWPKWEELGVDDKRWISSDCSGYIGYDYVTSRSKGPQIASKMAEICGITMEQLKSTPGAGAQWLIKNPTAAFWERAYYDSMKIHNYFQSVDSDIQKWTAEMWAQLFGMTREGIEVVIDHKELDFCLPTDPVEKWDKVKILHNAGVTGSGDMFFKGEWDNASPLRQDFSHICTDKATIKYVEAIKKVL